MIQRIQSLFLLGAIILQTTILFLPLAHFNINNQVAEMYSSGIINDETVLMRSTSLFLLCLVIIIMSILALVMFKNRILQMRLCIYNIILNLGLIALIIYLVHFYLKSFPMACFGYSWAIILPAISSILHSLAYRAIRKDENLLKSQDRLR